MKITHLLTMDRWEDDRSDPYIVLLSPVYQQYRRDVIVEDVLVECVLVEGV